MAYRAFAKVDPSRLAVKAPKSPWQSIAETVGKEVDKFVKQKNTENKKKNMNSIRPIESEGLIANNNNERAAAQESTSTSLQSVDANEDGSKTSGGVKYSSYDYDGDGKNDGEGDVTDLDYYAKPKKDDFRTATGGLKKKEFRKARHEWRDKKRFLRGEWRQQRDDQAEILLEDNAEKMAEGIKFGGMKRSTQKKLLDNVNEVHAGILPSVMEAVNLPSTGFTNINSDDAKFSMSAQRDPKNVFVVPQPDGTVKLRVFSLYDLQEPTAPVLNDFASQAEYDAAKAEYGVKLKEYETKKGEGGEWIEKDTAGIKSKPQRGQYSTDKEFQTATIQWSATGGGLWGSNALQKTSADILTSINSIASKLPGGADETGNFTTALQDYVQTEGGGAQIVGHMRNNPGLNTGDYPQLDKNNDQKIDEKDFSRLSENDLLYYMEGIQEGYKQGELNLNTEKASEGVLAVMSAVQDLKPGDEVGMANAIQQIEEMDLDFKYENVTIKNGKIKFDGVDGTFPGINSSITGNQTYEVDINDNNGIRDFIIHHAAGSGLDIDNSSISSSLANVKRGELNQIGVNNAFINDGVDGEESTIYNADDILGEGGGSELIQAFRDAPVHALDHLSGKGYGRVPGAPAVVRLNPNITKYPEAFKWYTKQKNDGVEHPQIPEGLLKDGAKQVYKDLLNPPQVVPEVKGLDNKVVKVISNIPTMTGAQKSTLATAIANIDPDNEEAIIDAVDDLKLGDDKTKEVLEALKIKRPKDYSDLPIPSEIKTDPKIAPSANWSDSRLEKYNQIANKRSQKKAWESKPANKSKTWTHAYELAKLEKSYVKSNGKLPETMSTYSSGEELRGILGKPDTKLGDVQGPLNKGEVRESKSFKIAESNIRNNDNLVISDNVKLDNVTPKVITLMNNLADKLDFKIPITNAFRSQSDTLRLKRAGYSPSKNSAHLSGNAADIGIGKANVKDRIAIIKALKEMGVKRIGIDGVHIHFDVDGTKSHQSWFRENKYKPSKAELEALNS